MSLRPETITRFQERMTRERLEQGLPPTIEDLDMLRVIGAIIVGALADAERRDAATTGSSRRPRTKR